MATFTALIPRLPCETCQESNAKCDLYAEFAAKFTFALLSDAPPGCPAYNPAWYRGLEGVVS